MQIFIGILIAFFFLVGFLFVYIRQCLRSSTSPDVRGRFIRRPPAVNSGLKPDVMDSFPVFAYSSVKDLKIGNEPLECAVCLTEFCNGDGDGEETLRLLPNCSHVFHVRCIDVWLAKHTTCPVCRAELGHSSDTPTESDTDLSARERNRSMETRDIEMNQVMIDIDADPCVNSQNLQQKSKNLRKFGRSKSTGHSLVQLGECAERYTLRVPEDVRNRLMVDRIRKLKRTKSCDYVLIGERSCRKGYRSGS